MLMPYFVLQQRVLAARQGLLLYRGTKFAILVEDKEKSTNDA